MNTIARSASSANGRAGGTKGVGPNRAIEVVNRQRLYRMDRDAVARLSRAVLDRAGREDATLTVIFIRDRLMRELNREYRAIDKPTDVLSFAYHEGGGFSEPASENHLGDVVISVDTAAAYASELGLTLSREIEHLVIHGALHLAGYDHETDDGQMEKLERKLRKELLQ
jgi:probable rRNA maturation factor